ENGRRRINQYTRILTLPLAIIQSVGILLLIRQQASGSLGIDIAGEASLFQWALMITSLTVGSLLLMWLGELITEQGIGNGISLLIFAGIISQLPQIISIIYSSTVASIGGANSSNLLGITLPVNFTVLGLLVGGVVFGVHFCFYVIMCGVYLCYSVVGFFVCVIFSGGGVVVWRVINCVGDVVFWNKEKQTIRGNTPLRAHRKNPLPPPTASR